MSATRPRGLTEPAADAAIDAACRNLRLPTLRSQFSELADAAARDQMTYRGFLAELLMAECDDRNRRRSEQCVRLHRHTDGLTYANSGITWLAFTATPDVDGRTAENISPNGSMQHYSYDTAGRLAKVADTYSLSCETRTYAFDVDTNRTSQLTYPGAEDGTCSTTTTATTVSHTYDAADRITESGYTYDAFGRTTAVPATSTANSPPVPSGDATQA
jgi:hypothetical protein